MRRLFVPEGCLQGEVVRLRGGEARYLRQVLRLTTGEQFSAVLPDGTERIAAIGRVDEAGVEATLGEELPARADPRVDVRLRPALVKARKLDLVVQKCTELGASEVAPVLCDRSVARPDREGLAHKLERWERIALEAARQCGRREPPRVRAPVAFEAALREVRDLGGTGLVLAPGAGGHAGPGCGFLSPDAGEPISVLVGPEGGFTAAEVSAALEAGLRAVGLGRRVLRAETAAIAICALLMGELGELA